MSTRQWRMTTTTIVATTLVAGMCLTTAAIAAEGDAAKSAGNAVTPGELLVERPTLICLGFEWRIVGDENRNAAVEVRYRKQGEPEWHDYLPLYRIGKGREVPPGFGNFNDPNHGPLYKIPDGFCGSIMDLEPATTYEVRLELRDPDGVHGEAVKQLTLATRAEPMPYADGPVRHVYPPDWKGPKQEPVYRGIMHAVNGFHTWCDCYQTVHPNKAPPGTVIKLHAGTYKANRDDYRDASGLWLQGTHTLIAKGTPDKPIAIIAAGDGEVVIDGDGCDNLFNVMASDYLYFEGLTIRNTRIALHGGFQGVLGCKGLTVKRCRFENIQYGVLAQDGRSSDFNIADNTFLGCNDSDRFHHEAGAAYGKSRAGYAVNLAGAGHVVCHNHAANFWDGMNVFTNSLADPALGQQSRAIDFYNNDLYNICDNFFESDGGYANIRMLRNRCFNSLAAPLSIQPVYAGPVYWIRNVVYNSHQGRQAFKMEAIVNDNVVCLHNTLTCHWYGAGGVQYADVRNNLFMGPAAFIGGQPPKKPQYVINAQFVDANSILDYNGHRVGLPVDEPLLANGKPYATLADMAAATGFEKHGLEVRDYSIFAGAEEPEHAPSNKGRLYRPDGVDLRAKPGSPIVDAGCVITGINDNFTGKAPDIGAYESDRPLPYYGPRK